jgi:NAD(P)-dependent dehydrogenase (short-subunit alcohol dehydrogenase family)
VPNDKARDEGTGGLHMEGCDLCREAEVIELFERTLDRFGHVDILVNNAGVAGDSMIHRGSLPEFRHTIDVNLQGTWLCTRQALQHMRSTGRGGAIVNITSVAGAIGNLGQAAYASSKAGVEALTKVTAREGAGYGIRANAIRPGLIRTDMTVQMSDEWWQAKVSSIPLGRPGEASEVALAALFLASPMAGYITGAVLDVSGGRHM